VLIRAIRPEDGPLLVELHASHSEHTIRMRFFAMVKLLSRDSLVRLCELDYDRAMALVAEYRDGAGRPHLCGVARYFLDAPAGTAEFAVVVSDPWQGHGLGGELMRRLIAVAKERGVRRLAGTVLRENTGMLRFVERLGFTQAPADEDNAVEVTLSLDGR
jgi:acetyltransferase